MKVYVDDEGMKAVKELCNVALKVGGIANLTPVNVFLKDLELLPKGVLDELAKKMDVKENEGKNTKEVLPNEGKSGN